MTGYGEYWVLQTEDGGYIGATGSDWGPSHWRQVTPKEPSPEERNVLLACHGSVIGMLSARWSDSEGENWKIDDALWDGDDAPTHFLRIPPPPFSS